MSDTVNNPKISGLPYTLRYTCPRYRLRIGSFVGIGADWIWQLPNTCGKPVLIIYCGLNTTTLFQPNPTILAMLTPKLKILLYYLWVRVLHMRRISCSWFFELLHLKPYIAKFTLWKIDFWVWVEGESFWECLLSVSADFFNCFLNLARCFI